MLDNFKTTIKTQVNLPIEFYTIIDSEKYFGV